jgi:hypothetical protein
MTQSQIACALHTPPLGLFELPIERAEQLLVEGADPAGVPQQQESAHGRGGGGS